MPASRMAGSMVVMMGKWWGKALYITRKSQIRAKEERSYTRQGLAQEPGEWRIDKQPHR